MLERSPEVSVAYRTLFILWVSFAGFQIFLFLLTWISEPESFNLTASKTFLGDNALLILFISLESVYALVISIRWHSKYIKKAVAEQKPEYVQTAMIIGAALAMSVSLWGVFLALAFEYAYSFIWMIVGFVATCLHFPSRRDLEAASMKTQ